MNYPSNQNNYGAVEEGIPVVTNEGDWKKAEIVDEEPLSVEQMMRLGFIRKVFGILSAQLILTAFMIFLTCTIKSFAVFQKDHFGIAITALIASIVSILIIVCCKGITRQVPHNYILLFIFTISEAYIVSLACIPFKSNVVLLAGFMTAGMTVGLLFYSLNTKKDFTTWGGMLFVLLLTLILFGIANIFFKNRLYEIIYCSFGVVLFGFYLVYDIQLLTGEKERSLDMDDYIYGSVSIYLDVINIFIYILRILGKSSGD